MFRARSGCRRPAATRRLMITVKAAAHIKGFRRKMGPGGARLAPVAQRAAPRAQSQSPEPKAQSTGSVLIARWPSFASAPDRSDWVCMFGQEKTFIKRRHPPPWPASASLGHHPCCRPIWTRGPHAVFFNCCPPILTNKSQQQLELAEILVARAPETPAPKRKRKQTISPRGRPAVALKLIYLFRRTVTVPC